LSQYNFKYAFVSPFTRTIQTANEIVQKHNIPICLENGLTEWSPYQELVPPSQNTHKHFRIIDTNYDSKMKQPEKNETEKALLLRGKQTISYIINTYMPDDSANILIVSHAAPAIAMVTTT
jgi:broad specificity phosphatase PhoE